MEQQITMPANEAGQAAKAVEVKEKKPKKPRKKRSLKKKIFLAVIVVLAGWLAIGQIIAAVRGPLPTPVSAEEIKTGVIDQRLSTSGSLISGNKMTVYAPVSAKVEAISVKIGDRVRAGDALLTYDTTELARSYQVASAAAASGNLQKQDSLTASDNAQKTFNEAATNLANVAVQKDNAAAKVKTLTEQYAAFADPSVPEAIAVKTQLDAAAADFAAQQSALSAAKAGYDAAKSGVLSDGQKQQLAYGQVSAQASLAGAKENLAAGRAGVVAPISGVVTSLSADAGAATGQYAPVCVIEGLDDLRVDVALSRYDLQKVQIGQKATVTILGKEYTGRVARIDGMATQTASTNGTAAYVHAQIKLDQPDEKLVLGIEASVTIDTGRAEDVLIVPLSAVNTDVNGQFCYVIENGAAVRRTVTLGLSGDTSAEVVSGLSAGDMVITTPDVVLAEGQSVAAAQSAIAGESGESAAGVTVAAG